MAFSSEMSYQTDTVQRDFGEISVALMSDHALLEATRIGDETAFAEIVRRYRNPLTNYIFRMLNDYEEAVDLTQETFLRLYLAVERYHDQYAFSTYLYRIATNLAISEIRKRRRRKLFSLTGFFQGANGEESDFDAPDKKPLPDVELADNELQRLVAKAIATLPEKYRAPLILRDIEGKTYEEIVTILASNEGTIKSRISRGRKMLREKLGFLATNSEGE